MTGTGRVVDGLVGIPEVAGAIGRETPGFCGAAIYHDPGMQDPADPEAAAFIPRLANVNAPSSGDPTAQS